MHQNNFGGVQNNQCRTSDILDIIFIPYNKYIFIPYNKYNPNAFIGGVGRYQIFDHPSSGVMKYLKISFSIHIQISFSIDTQEILILLHSMKAK